MESCKSVREYYKGKTIFITGATGFFGKALIEKLLRSCPDIRHIYGLVRTKKGKTLNERIEHLFSNPIFDLLRDTKPESFSKVTFINGDVCEENLGLSNSDMKMLIENVNIIFHTAASVRFDDFLGDAIQINLRSSRDLALMALKMEKLEVFVHVSTAYASVTKRKIIPEELLPVHDDWKEMICLAEKSDTNILNYLSHKIVGKYPNTYTYTKHLAEHCINDLLGAKVPTVIVKPTVVSSSITEPMRGWTDNFNGPISIALGSCSGVLRICLADMNAAVDYVPVDTIVKALILSAWKTAQTPLTATEVIQPSAFGFKKYSMKLIVDIGSQVWYKYPLDVQIWYPNVKFTQSLIYYYINAVLFHLIPAVCIDLLLRLFRCKPILFKLHRKICAANLAISYFLENEWDFLNSKALSLVDGLDGSEKEDFKYVFITDNEVEYLKWNTISAKWLLLGQSKHVKPSAVKINRGFYYLDKICKGIFYIWLIWLVFFKYHIQTTFFEATSNYWNRLGQQ
ncbi:fatty acyl-CoA reductase 1-like isoform X1 [Sitophilus oryzae]|uniref:Fatty acyl-CoA reductase n=1 Tax=Sitophilus oryzae TaxID=7048 RepID=A0A6J2YLM1_SITOR|nr:fatty acyl-CoA reductase 1-like isoform X1 [Sitophilus oryzae]